MEAEESKEPRKTPTILCDVCTKGQMKYKCPRCHTKSCSLACVKIHKTRQKCSGVPDKGHFVDLKSFTLQQLKQDVRFISDVIDVANRNTKHFTSTYREAKIEGRLKQLRSSCYCPPFSGPINCW